MSTPRSRRLYSFAASGGTPSVIFPTMQMSWQTKQLSRINAQTSVSSGSSTSSDVGLAYAVGTSYAIDLLSGMPAPMEISQETLSAAIGAGGLTGPQIDAQLDALRAALVSIGLGKLWTMDDNGDQRWAWARITQLPDVTLGVSHIGYAPFQVVFVRLSDWQSPTETTLSETVTTASYQFTASPAGSATVGSIVFLLTANAAGGFDAPSLSNALTGETWSSTRVAANGDQLRIDTGRMAVEYSTDGGVTWTPDYANFSIGATQAGFMRFGAYANTLTLTNNGSPNCTLSVSWFDAWH